VGSAPIRNLTVLFPEEQVHFGDVAVGATSTYVDVQHGVYRYAAYRLEVDGTLVTQPVIDWVGEEPMEGQSFTYSLAVDLYRNLTGRKTLTAKVSGIDASRDSFRSSDRLRSQVGGSRGGLKRRTRG